MEKHIQTVKNMCLKDVVSFYKRVLGAQRDCFEIEVKQVRGKERVILYKKGQECLVRN